MWSGTAEENTWPGAMNKEVASLAKKIIAREIIGSPSTERVEKRYHELLTKEAYIDSQRAKLYTDYFPT